MKNQNNIGRGLKVDASHVLARQKHESQMKHKNLILRSLFFSGVHCAEEGHQEDVRHEVHEQAEVC